MVVRRDEYEKRGDYHRDIDKKWRYYPVYVEKISFVKSFLESMDKSKRILDVGCGEGVLVEEYHKKGFNISGLDINYSSPLVTMGDITESNLPNRSFDVIICLDLIEHLTFEKQEKALIQIKRILKDDGIFFITIPNLAHLASRISFLFLGRLLRTSSPERHKGDRPIKEYLELLEKHGFKIVERKGIFPTYPLSSLLTYFFPDKVLPLHKLLNKFLSYPNWCFLNIIVCKKS